MSHSRNIKITLLKLIFKNFKNDQLEVLFNNERIKENHHTFAIEFSNIRKLPYHVKHQVICEKLQGFNMIIFYNPHPQWLLLTTCYSLAIYSQVITSGTS